MPDPMPIPITQRFLPFEGLPNNPLEVCNFLNAKLFGTDVYEEIDGERVYVGRVLHVGAFQIFAAGPKGLGGIVLVDILPPPPKLYKAR